MSTGGDFVYICTMNINEIYKLISYLVDKYQGTYLSPDDFNQVINMAQRQYINYLTEDGSGHMGMRLGRKAGMLINAPVVESLSIFLTDATLAVNQSTQIATQPADLYRLVSMRTTNDTNVIRKITPDKLAEILDDAIDPPTTTDPIYVDTGSNYKIFPLGVTNVKITYVRTPNDMKWAYTGNLNYDQANSVQPEWEVKDLDDIIYRAIGIIGINLKDGDLRTAAQLVKQQGE